MTLGYAMVDVPPSVYYELLEVDPSGALTLSGAQRKDVTSKDTFVPLRNIMKRPCTELSSKQKRNGWSFTFTSYQDGGVVDGNIYFETTRILVFRSGDGNTIVKHLFSYTRV